jgi:hypothetical protein
LRFAGGAMIHEPMTVATDYLMAISALAFGMRLLRSNRLWALAFFCTAAASFFGGTYHGIAPQLAPIGQWMLWKATVFSVGFASFFLLSARGRLLASIAVIKLVLYVSWMTAHDDFVWVIADYGTTLLLVGIEQTIAWIRERAASAPWVLGSILVSIVGAAVQQSGAQFHTHFNHNDLYHLIQIVALWLLYRGGILMTSAKARPSIQPM